MQDKEVGMVVCVCCHKQQPYHGQVLCVFSNKRLRITSFISKSYIKGSLEGYGVPVYLLMGG